MAFDKISHEGPLYLILDTIFKISLGIYLVWFFTYEKINGLNHHDRLLFIISGFILLITIDYKEIFYLIGGQNNSLSEDQNKIHVVSKPCPPCHEKDRIY